MKYCLIGDKLSHSYSSDIHKKSGIDYCLKEVEKKDLKEFLSSREYDGFNVTIPYKVEIIPYLSGISKEAEKIGAVNTVVKKDGKPFGYNTDYFGLKSLLKKNKIRLKGKSVAVMGSGGAGKTACYVAKGENCKSVSVISRTGEINYRNCYEKLKDTEVLINATPVGMQGRESEEIIDVKKFRKLKAVIDLIYNPYRTNLILKAEKQKIKAVNGLDMLLFQALKSQELWGEKQIADVNGLRKDLILSKTNVVLSGMPGCGKTTIGKLLAKELNREFFDVDAEIEKESGLTADEFIKEKGEKAFREAETKVIRRLSDKQGVVISLGGGSVLSIENEFLLKKNGIVICLKRRLKYLSTESRPLSEAKGVKKLYKERKRRYFESADIKVINGRSAKKTVKEIVRKYENTCR